MLKVNDTVEVIQEGYLDSGKLGFITRLDCYGAKPIWVQTKEGMYPHCEEELRLVHPGHPGFAAAHRIREFASGATRDTDTGKLDYEAGLSPIVLERYLQYLQKHTIQADGNTRPFDNWQKGMGKDVYIKSACRHFVAFWKKHRNFPEGADLEESICAILFNCQGYLFELLKEKQCKQ